MEQPTLLIVDDDEDIRYALTLLFQQNGFRVLEAQTLLECELLLQRVSPDLVLLDMNFRRDTTSGKEGLEFLAKLNPLNIPVMLMTAWANIELAVKGLQLGAVDFIEKPWQKQTLLDKVKRNLASSKTPALNIDKPMPWIAKSTSMVEIEHLICKLATTDANILLLGENGTGKSLLAKRIHQLSLRNDKPFIAINMGAIPETLVESELFGHKKGAFTDAKNDRLGAFANADKGTLFMDEIATLPISSQPKLLQVLETGDYSCVGADTNSLTNVRVLAATNQDLRHAIEQGAFRQDLLYRLNTFVITLPPLRDRKEDIEPLALTMLMRLSKKYNSKVTKLSKDAVEALQQHTWPGNVRELNHVIERAVLLCGQEQVDSEHLIIEQVTKVVSSSSITNITLDELEKQRIEAALSNNDNHLNDTAFELGISRNALYRRLEKHGLEKRRD